MTDVILVAGLAWWFGGTYFGTQHRLRNRGPGGILGSAPQAALYLAGGAASVSTIALALTASVRIANIEGDFGLYVFGAVLSAMVAGCALGAARA